MVEASGLTKTYPDLRRGHFVALDHVSFTVGEGEIIGPNGAGKTTALRILSTVLQPTSGSARVNGFDVMTHPYEVRHSIGFVSSNTAIYDRMTAWEMVAYFGKLYGMEADRLEQRMREVFAQFDMEPIRDIPGARMSTGMRQKLGLIQAMMHRPQLLILDEPTNGLDPLVRNVVFEELREVVAQGRTVLFSSHSLAEVESLCDEVIILREGRVVEHETIASLRKRAIRRVEIIFRDDPPVQLPDGLTLQHGHGRVWRCTWNGPTRQLLKWLAAQSIEDVVIESPDLNDLFLAYYHTAESPAEPGAVTSRPADGATDENSSQRTDGAAASDRDGRLP